MIGKQIADLIMQPKKQSFSDGIDFLEKEGFSDALEDYFNVWNKTRFRVKSGDIWILGEYIKNPAAAENEGERLIEDHDERRVQSGIDQVEGQQQRQDHSGHRRAAHAGIDRRYDQVHSHHDGSRPDHRAQ